MIDFPCHCGYRFSVPEDMAAGEIQCPKCGRLNDVPKLGELKQLDPDGTYRLESPAVQGEHRLEQLQRVYGRHKTEADGSAIDLRVPARPADGSEPAPLCDEPPRLPPRYDPETGELIRPLDLVPAPQPVVADIPMAQVVLQYSTAAPSEAEVHPRAALVALLRPENLTVMFCVLLVNVMVGLIMGLLPPVLFLAPMLVFLAMIALIAHYGNVIEDIGPDDRDKLPRFLRDFSLGDDVWRPLVNVALALMLCYGLPLITRQLTSLATLRQPVTLVLAGLGTLMFPAVLLTSVTSGTVLNLRPDRCGRVIGAIGARYVLILAVFVLGVAFYGAGIVATAMNVAVRFRGLRISNWLFVAPVAYSLLIVGIYLMHYFCWLLGLEYRRRHAAFGWVLQEHQRPPPVIPAMMPRGSAEKPAGDAHRVAARPEDGPAQSRSRAE